MNCNSKRPHKHATFILLLLFHFTGPGWTFQLQLDVETIPEALDLSVDWCINAHECSYHFEHGRPLGSGIVRDPLKMGLTNKTPVTVKKGRNTSHEYLYFPVQFVRKPDSIFSIILSKSFSQGCYMKSEVVESLLDYFPSFVRKNCMIKFYSLKSDEFAVETNGGDLVSVTSQCINASHNLYIKGSYACNLSDSSIAVISSNFKLELFMDPVSRQQTKRRKRALKPKNLFFDNSLYVVTIAEDKEPGSTVTTLSVKDGIGSVVQYTMVAVLDARSQKLFSIDQTSGIVTTAAKLDRESMETHYFRITAVDDSQIARTATTTLQINVDDVNDHTPQFEQSVYETNIRESATIGTNVLTIRATDQDAGPNAEIHYSILNPFGPNEAFRIDWKTGVITSRQTLDREQIAVYNITIQAMDQGPVAERRSATAQVIVNVVDENDNYPQFTERTYTVEVPENIGWSTNPVIAKIRASDADTGPNAAIRYSLIGGNTQGHFAIDSLSGDVSVIQPLDFESIRTYRLVVRAQDGGSPSRSNTTQLLINVKDVNDHAPRFYSQMFQENVIENVPIGHSIVRVQAYDADDGVNAAVGYQLDKTGLEDMPFSVDSETGWVVTSRVLDREEGEHYEFKVIAIDGGDPPKSATATVAVHVQDLNDNDPVFEPHEYEAIIAEDAPPGTPVLTVSATDRDENPRIHYQLTGGNVRSRFSLTSQNGAGLLSIAQPLDYKQEKRFVLTITATDSGGRSDTATVYVNVSDANTYAPTFETTPYSANVFEDTPLGTTVLVVSATDGDVGENARITYSLSGEPVPEFSVNPNSGAIVTLKPLDREKTSVYLLTVTARDNGHPPLSDTTDVEITVTDVNDNPPVFGQSQYKGSIAEDVPVGASVLQVTATDADQGLNGRVKFSLAEGQAGGSNAFVIDPTSGVLRTARPLDRETVASYDLIAFAVDKGSPELSSTVLIQVTVDDINDSPPVFEGDRIKLFIEENSPIGSKVGDIVAHDPDEGANAVIQYAIIGGADADSFTLVPRSDDGKAELLTRIDLDYESAKKKYEIVVRASSPPLRTDVTVEVNVVDVNDNAPILKNFRIIFNNYKNQFPSGPIGRVPVFDADVTDKLQFRILSGNNAELITLNNTAGLIMLSPSLQDTNVPITATMEVAVSDGLNEVRAEMQLTVLLVTDAMLFNSVTVRLAEMNKEAFLSPLLTYFTEGLAAIIPCAKEDIHIFSIQDDTDVDARVLNVSFSARKPDGESFFSQQYLQEKIYLSRSTLAKLATVQVLPFDDTLCVREPCLNYEQCVSVLKFGNASDFIASDSVLFRPIYPVNTFACRCPVGFTGMREHYACDVEVNLCYSSPCLNGGSCMRKEGGYTCVCKSGFKGKGCEIDINKDTCRPGVCHSGSVCAPREGSSSPKCNSSIKGPECIPKGIQCKNCSAPSEWATETCSLRARTFTKGSFLTFPALRQRYRLHLKLSFATRQKNGLLLYNGRYNEMHDFIALEIINSYLRFSYSFGGNTSEVKVTIPGGLSDGNWHTVTLDYVNMNIYDRPHNGKFYYDVENLNLNTNAAVQWPVTATLSVDDCNSDIAVKFGSKLGSSWQCANQSRQILEARCVFLTEVCHRFFDLTAPLQIGGLPAVGGTFPVSTSNFEGCMKDLYVDHELIDLNSFVSDNGTSPGCPDKRGLCSSNPCQHGGRCKEGWSTYVCECPDGWGAKDCSEAIDPAKSLQGEGYITYVPGLRPVQFPYIASVSFRTRQPSGILMRVDAGQSTSFTMQVLDGRIEYRINENATRIESPHVNDGKWHNIEAKWMPGEVWMSLDYGNHEITTLIPSEFKLQGSYVSKISVGGLEPAHSEALNYIGFHGCLKDMRSGNNKNAFLKGGQEVKAKDGCPSFDGCTKQSCPRTATCVDTWQGYSCSCQPGYVGVDCISICELNPCENGASCLLDRSTANGYRCVCQSDAYSGTHCEELVKQTCPASWWGHPVCGPCDCDVDKGYNPSCNKTNGMCSCHDHRFRPEGIDHCLDCECYSVGSFGSRCDAVTGQCKCRPGVIGRTCDSCPNPNAEVTLTGCEVIYDGCPKSFDAGVWWPRAPFGNEVQTECPSGSKGKAIRTCLGEGLGWGQPDLFNCTSSPLLKSREMISKLNNGLLSMSAGTAQRLAGLLFTGLNSTGELFGADVLIAFETLLKVVDHENKQQGLGLSHRQDRNFIKKDWERIRELTSEGPELLLREMHKYSGLLARTQADTFTRPFLVVSPRIVFGLDTISSELVYGTELRPTFDIEVDDLKSEPMVLLADDSNTELSLRDKPSISLPKFDNIVRNNLLWDQQSNIQIPYETLGIKKLKQGETATSKTYPTVKAVVGYAILRELGLLLPPAYELNLRQRWGVDMVAEKNVFFSQIHHVEGPRGSVSEEPLMYKLWIGETDVRSNPQCVHWKSEEQRWSREKCVTDFLDFRKPVVDFVNCTCTTSDPVTVVMNRVEPLALVEPSTAENIVTYVGLVISLTLLAVAFLILSCLLGKGANTNSINKNIIASLFMTQLLYLLALKLRAEFISEEFMCKMMAIGLQYTWLLVFTWIAVSALHLYRMLTEIRDVNAGPMRCYYAFAYAVPAIVTALTVGVRADQYGTVAFCWLSVYESAAWGLVGPSCALMLISLALFGMGLRAASTVKDHIEDYGFLRSYLWLGLILLPLSGCLWSLALLNASENHPALAYALSMMAAAMGVYILFGYCLGNSRVRTSFRRTVAVMTGKKVPVEETTSPWAGNSAPRSALAYRNGDHFRSSRRHVGISTTSTTSRSTVRTGSSPYRSELGGLSESTVSNSLSDSTYKRKSRRRKKQDTSRSQTEPGSETDTKQFYDTETNSDEDRTLDLASSHSSDEDDTTASLRRNSNGKHLKKPDVAKFVPNIGGPLTVRPGMPENQLYASPVSPMYASHDVTGGTLYSAKDTETLNSPMYSTPGMLTVRQHIKPYPGPWQPSHSPSLTTLPQGSPKWLSERLSTTTQSDNEHNMSHDSRHGGYHARPQVLDSSMARASPLHGGSTRGSNVNLDGSNLEMNLETWRNRLHSAIESRMAERESASNVLRSDVSRSGGSSNEMTGSSRSSFQEDETSPSSGELNNLDEPQDLEVTEHQYV